MKMKLVRKAEGWYNLYDGEVGIGSTHEELQQPYKLSKQNCDEIFGVTDVEKLAEEFVNDLQVASETVNRAVKLGYEEGFNKAMELNKDKVFTIEDMKKAIDKAKQGSVKETHNGYGRPTEPIFVLDDLSYDEIIQSLQPTEIEVEIETETKVWEFISNGEFESFEIIPKLDETGCIILKMI
jgi:hypothetical protein